MPAQGLPLGAASNDVVVAVVSEDDTPLVVIMESQAVGVVDICFEYARLTSDRMSVKPRVTRVLSECTNALKDRSLKLRKLLV